MTLFKAGDRFYKGNLHMHTTLSDGVRTPEAACAIYKKNGYDFVAITDHRVIGQQCQKQGLLVLSGGEYDFSVPNQQLHLVAVMPDNSLAGTQIAREDPNAFIRHINAHDGLVILAHPTWSLNTIEFIRSLEGLAAAEVFNSVSDVPWNGARADSGHILDLLYTSGRLLPQVAADDTHWYEGEQCKSYVMVQAHSLTPQAILKAMREGRFYASQGPEIKTVEILEDRVIIDTSPVAQVVFYSNLAWVKDRCRQGEGIVHSEYVFQRDSGERFVRCEITDSHGRRAWLSPIAL